MNILFLFVSLPNLENETQLFSSLIHEFKKNGHNVLVSTRDNVNRKHSELVVENGIQVLRIKSQPFTGVSNPIKKALAYQEYVVKQRYLLKKQFASQKIDLIISHSLPPELAWVISGLKNFFKCPFYLLQTDFTWQDAVAYGMFGKNSPIGLYYRFWEKWMMKLADYVGCPTDGNIEFIRKEYPWMSLGKFGIVRFWQKEICAERSEALRRELGLEGKFVAIYGGSVGKAQRLEHVIELAEACKDYEDLVFLILGKGAYLPVIEKMVSDKQLNNVMFKQFMPQEQYLQLLASCDAGFIILNEKHATPNFPSKTMSYFNLRVPVLAAIDPVTDYGKYLDENKAGLWSIAGDVESFRANLLKYYNSKDYRKEVKENAYRLYKETMLPVHAYHSIMSQISKSL